MIPDALATNLLTGLFGAVIGALSSGVVQSRTRRREMQLAQTLALVAEFHAPAFNRIRIKAYEALESAPTLGMPSIYAGADPETKEAVASMVHFFEKAALLARAGALDVDLLSRFLHQYAGWWGKVLCEQDVNALADPEWGQTLSEIHRLFKRLARRRRLLFLPGRDARP